MKINLPHLSYQKIGQIADLFLSKYHSSFSLPIPIEEIAEAKLHLKIIPQINLKKDYDIDGFLTSDLSSIFIDFNLYLKFENRTRLTIAHEIGHLILHGNFFQRLNINSLEALNNFAAQITDEDYRWLEYQAYSFAGQVLVPKKQLFQQLEKRLGKIPTSEETEMILPVLQELIDIFNVSGEVLLRRLMKENIVKPNS